MKKKKVYTVATAHLDTIWSWDFETTVRKYIYNTMVDNLKLFEKYPDYKFNFEGAYRYELMEEYYPELFENVKEKIAQGRWNVCGSAYENGDVNMPSPEALFRNFLYGNGYFYKKFGKKSQDIFLPDCFGFGWALPSIAKHSGITGFSSQKLSWGSAYGVPFDIGKWYGVDGNCIFASLKMNAYDKALSEIRTWKFILDKLNDNEKFDLNLTSVYHGTGDRGGSPKERSVATVQREIDKNGESDIEVISARADELFDNLSCSDASLTAKLPIWNNELLMSTHAVGSYVSRAIGKRWNRKGEELADMAEKSAVLAYLLGREYPIDTLTLCWKRIIAHQFHDDITGTSVQRAYRRCWNDYALSINQLVSEYEAASEFIVGKMDTSWVEGTAVAVNNSLEYNRTGVVEVNGDFPKESYIALDKSGNKMPCQKTRKGLLFKCEVKSLGYKIFDIKEGKAESESNLSVTFPRMENENLTVLFGEDGWVSSIFDKKANSELLKAPIKLALYDYKGSNDWPAWEIPNNEGLKDAHYPVFKGFKVLENGCCRVSLELLYEYKKSEFRTVVSLTSGGKAVEFQNEIMWHEFRTLAKQEFAFTVSNPNASFDLGLGVIKRGNRTDKLYEVPAQKWADITDKDSNLGISIISDSKYSWDKLNNNTLRMTVLHTPAKNYRIDSMQSMMDLGLNRYGFAVTAHEGSDFSQTNRCAYEFHQPLTSFVCSKHGGDFHDELSLGNLEKGNVILRAVKKAENSDGIVFRFNEYNGEKSDDVKFKLNFPVTSGSEILASEDILGKAQVSENSLSFDITPYSVKSFELIFTRKEKSRAQTPVDLNGNLYAYSANSSKQKGILPRCNLSIPTELVKNDYYVGGNYFQIDTDKKVIWADSQIIDLPEETKKAHMLCASLSEDKTVKINNQDVKINSMTERYAGWDLYDYRETAFIKKGKLGVEFTHCHSNNGDEIAKQLYFWSVTVEAKDGKLVLPKDKDILIIAITADSNENECNLSTDICDKVEKRAFTFQMDEDELKKYKKFKRYSKMNDKGRYFKTYNK